MKSTILFCYFLMTLFLMLLSACIGRIPSEYSMVSKENSLYQKKFKINDLTRTDHKSSIKKPIFSLANKSSFYLYIINNRDTKWIRIVFEYNGIDRLLFEKISFKSSKTQKLEWNFSKKQESNNRHGGVVSEKMDFLMTNSEFGKFKEILNPRSIIQYKFSSGHEEEYSISKDQLKYCQQIIQYYESIPYSDLR